MLAALAQWQTLNPRIKVTLVRNYHFERNPYHPGQAAAACGMSRLGQYVLRRETAGGLTFLRDRGCRFEFRTYRNRYTYNKIFIVDRGRFEAMGTFNLHRRSLEAGNDCEIGILLDASNGCATSTEEQGDTDRDNKEGSKAHTEDIRKMASKYIESVMKQTEPMSKYSTNESTTRKIDAAK